MEAGEEADNHYHVILPRSLLYALACYFRIPLCNPPAYTWFKFRSLVASPHRA